MGFELSEIEKQGAERYWTDIFNDKQKFDTNKNGLLLPWLIGCLEGDANVDPITNREEPLMLTGHYAEVNRIRDQLGRLPFDIERDADVPDIDIDCLPLARDEIKAYASQRYGSSKVASVGTWSTLQFKAALGDVYNALGLDKVDSGNEYIAVLGPDEARRQLRFKMDDENAQGAKRGTGDKTLAVCVTKMLPDDVNDMQYGGISACKGKIAGQEKECGYKHDKIECPSCGSKETEHPTLGSVLKDNEVLSKFYQLSDEHANAVKTATRLVGCIRNAGKHAGAIIIADRDLFGNVPMQYDSVRDQWVSVWTEGSNPQLSKFGYNKWDILGLKNLLYIYNCCRMIEENHGISFGDRLEGLDDIDPEGEGRAGVYWKDGEKHDIPLHDKKALALANDQRTDAVFQFDTDLAKRILSNGVESFWDLLIFNAMGHPGPMAMIPEYVNRRTDDSWKTSENAEFLKVLGPTKGIIVYQEQLTDLWQRIAGFTGPEAQFARKAVAKKWRDKLKPVRQKWIDGASKIIGESQAVFWWDDRMTTFGRYAFNKSHAIAYCLWAYRCLWFKAYFPEEWWASVMSHCHQDKLVRYMSAARGDDVIFGEVNVNRLTTYPTAHSGKTAKGDEAQVALGLISFKKVGDSICKDFADDSSEVPDERRAPDGGYTDIDHFIKVKGKNKTLMERLIKLGAFSHIHPNTKALWMWYVHKYCTGEVVIDGQKQKITKLKEEHRERIRREVMNQPEGWTPETIAQEIDRQINDWQAANPAKQKVPLRIQNWKPKPPEERDIIMSLYPDDYTLSERLDFEMEFLGYYWHSPTDLYHTSGDSTIEHAKFTSRLEGVITDKFEGITKNNGSRYMKLTITDGRKECMVMLWERDIERQIPEYIKIDCGIRIMVDYDPDRNSFVIMRGTKIEPLFTIQAWEEMQDGVLV